MNNKYTVTFTVPVLASSEEDAVKKATALVKSGRTIETDVLLEGYTNIPKGSTGWLYECRSSENEEWDPVVLYHDFYISYDSDDSYEIPDFDTDCAFFKGQTAMSNSYANPDVPGWNREHPCECSGWDDEQEHFYRLRKVVLGQLSDKVAKYLKNNPSATLRSHADEE